MAAAKLKILSGGQTGVDRGALEAALALGAPCGGWCPAGRLDEFGRIPERYPVTELPEGGFKERTIRNVQDSDGTLILYFSTLQGGTETTVLTCVEHAKPYKLIDCTNTPPERTVELAEAFIQQHRITTLNVAGPRASEHTEAYECAFQAVSGLLRKVVSRESV